MNELTPLVDANVVEDLLKELGLTYPSSVSSGRIKANCRHFPDADSTLQAFIAFGGQGWLCTAESPTIEEFNGSGLIKPEGQWPRWGELVNGEISLHLRHTGAGWSLVELWEVADSEGILMKKHYLGKNNRLNYHVFYELQETNGELSYRPRLSRFLGFSKGDGMNE
jgi:hypothetical protein